MNKTPTHFRVPPIFQTPLRWNYYHWPVPNPHPTRRAQRKFLPKSNWRPQDWQSCALTNQASFTSSQMKFRVYNSSTFIDFQNCQIVIVHTISSLSFNLPWRVTWRYPSHLLSEGYRVVMWLWLQYVCTYFHRRQINCSRVLKINLMLGWPGEIFNMTVPNVGSD